VAVKTGVETRRRRAYFTEPSTEAGGAGFAAPVRPQLDRVISSARETPP
jgi:hypothetical protein